METWEGLEAAAQADGVRHVAAEAVVTDAHGGLLLLQLAEGGGWVLPSAGPGRGDVSRGLRSAVQTETGLAVGDFTGPHGFFDAERLDDGRPAAMVRHYLFRAAAPEAPSQVVQAGDRLITDNGLRPAPQFRNGGFIGWASGNALVMHPGAVKALDALLGDPAPSAGLFEAAAGTCDTDLATGAIDYGHFTLLFPPRGETVHEVVVPDGDRIAAGNGGWVAIPAAHYSQQAASFRLTRCTGPQEGPQEPWVSLGTVPVDLVFPSEIVLASTVHGVLLRAPVRADEEGRHTLGVWRRSWTLPDGEEIDLFDIRLWSD